MRPRTDADSGGTAWSQDVRATLRRMDPAQSRLLQMVYFERRTHTEVAAELEMPRAVFAGSLARAMQALGLLLIAAAGD